MNNLLDFEPKFSEDEMAMATFLATFSQICTSYPKINPQSHMRAICRSKGEPKENPKKGNVEFVDPYSWGATFGPWFAPTRLGKFVHPTHTRGRLACWPVHLE